jgi:hypothetical protein
MILPRYIHFPLCVISFFGLPISGIALLSQLTSALPRFRGASPWFHLPFIALVVAGAIALHVFIFEHVFRTKCPNCGTHAKFQSWGRPMAGYWCEKCGWKNNLNPNIGPTKRSSGRPPLSFFVRKRR